MSVEISKDNPVYFKMQKENVTGYEEGVDADIALSLEPYHFIHFDAESTSGSYKQPLFEIKIIKSDEIQKELNKEFILPTIIVVKHKAGGVSADIKKNIQRDCVKFVNQNISGSDLRDYIKEILKARQSTLHFFMYHFMMNAFMESNKLNPNEFMNLVVKEKTGLSSFVANKQVNVKIIRDKPTALKLLNSKTPPEHPESVINLFYCKDSSFNEVIREAQSNTHLEDLRIYFYIPSGIGSLQRIAIANSINSSQILSSRTVYAPLKDSSDSLASGDNEDDDRLIASRLQAFLASNKSKSMSGLLTFESMKMFASESSYDAPSKFGEIIMRFHNYFAHYIKSNS